MDRFKCPCAYIYDEKKGCAVFRNPPGTLFRELPDDWICPRCGYEKVCFRKLEEDKEKKMAKHDVVVFKPYPFVVGQKIYIEEGARRGDWEVIGVSDSAVKLRCPVSFKEFQWKRFCYFVDQQTGREWPSED